MYDLPLCIIEQFNYCSHFFTFNHIIFYFTLSFIFILYYILCCIVKRWYHSVIACNNKTKDLLTINNIIRKKAGYVDIQMRRCHYFLLVEHVL